MAVWILIWIATVVLVWRFARMAKRHLALHPGFAVDCLSSLVTGTYIAYTFAPGGISAGFAAIPAPATFALIGYSLRGQITSHEARAHFGILAITFVIVTIVHFPFARAARRARERDQQFDERQRAISSRTQQS